MNTRKSNVAKIFGIAAELVVGIVVMGFLFTESMNFFYFAFPPEQRNLAWLGLGLTGGGMIGYFVMLKTGRADTDLKKFIVLTMIVVCALGELATAGYGTQVEALKNSGQVITADGIKSFVLAIRILGLFHAIALIGFIGGDDIAAIFQDKNNNGIPDGFERKSNNQPRQPFKPNFAPNNQDVPQEVLKERDNGNKSPNSQGGGQ